MSADSEPAGTRTLDLNGAAALLMMSAAGLTKKARRGQVPGAKVGRAWVFIEADLVELIREQARARASVGRGAASALTATKYPAAMSPAAQASLPVSKVGAQSPMAGLAQLQKDHQNAMRQKAHS